jgi:hypothetical protein
MKYLVLQLWKTKDWLTCEDPCPSAFLPSRDERAIMAGPPKPVIPLLRNALKNHKEDGLFII